MNVTDIPNDVIKLATEAALIQAKVMIDPSGIAICHNGKRFVLYQADAWERPSQPPLLPWSAPKETALAIVDKEGKLLTIHTSMYNEPEP